MFMFLGLTGMVGFAVCLVVFIISLVRKRSKKVAAIGMAVCVVLFFVGLALTPPYPDKPADEKAAPVVAESSADKEEAPASSGEADESVSAPEGEKSAEGTAPPSEAPPSEPAEVKPSETPEAVSSSPAPSSTEDEPISLLGDKVIPGLMAADIKLNLKKWGLKDASPKRVEGFKEVTFSSSVTDPDTGAMLTYFLSTDSVMHVKAATFSVTNMAVISGEDFLAVAGGYLGYCATVPYDDADPAKAKKWIEDNIEKCNEPGKIETLVIGGAEFSLYGNATGARVLDIKAVKKAGGDE